MLSKSFSVSLCFQPVESGLGWIGMVYYDGALSSLADLYFNYIVPVSTLGLQND